MKPQPKEFYSNKYDEKKDVENWKKLYGINPQTENPYILRPGFKPEFPNSMRTQNE